ncbi:hypothetical protein DRE_01283 [Drechslerella stenobrocha 248]|uniref:Uncharacterized protein n=1 Tax=Drechslerella stenobrocha 248 TaxID=1043628 RepID=W7HJ07_9PEZI|nr:hypothetical protein DRE_01283 [Drechslerella stenobrocha 248]
MANYGLIGFGFGSIFDKVANEARAAERKANDARAQADKANADPAKVFHRVQGNARADTQTAAKKMKDAEIQAVGQVTNAGWGWMRVGR